MWLFSSGRSSAKRPQFAPWPRTCLRCRWCSGPQICSPARAGQCRVDRAAGGREAPARAAHEAALLVRLVELERLDQVAELALPAHQRLLEEARDVGEGMHHQPLADQAGRVGQPVGMRGLADRSSSLACRWRSRQGPRRAPARNASLPSRSIQVAPVARPSALVSIRRTRAPVTSRAPMAIALGQWVRSVEALAPSLQPYWQVRALDARRGGRRTGVELIELNSGHQCQPSFVWARASFSPALPMGSGGIGGSSVSCG